jgi:tellurite resistance protein TehA-like permease
MTNKVKVYILDKILLLIMALIVLPLGVFYFGLTDKFHIDSGYAMYLLELFIYFVVMLCWFVIEKKYKLKSLEFNIFIILVTAPVLVSEILIIRDIIKLPTYVLPYILTFIALYFIIISIFKFIVRILHLGKPA